MRSAVRCVGTTWWASQVDALHMISERNPAMTDTTVLHLCRKREGWEKIVSVSDSHHWKLTMLLGRLAARRAHIRSHSGVNVGVALAHSPMDLEFTTGPVCSGPSCWRGCVCHFNRGRRVVKVVTRNLMHLVARCFLNWQRPSEEASQSDGAHNC